MYATHRTIFMTEWGEAVLIWTKEGICGLVRPGLSRGQLMARINAEFPESVTGAQGEVEDVVSQVKSYFEGAAVRFRVGLDLCWATPFQRRVYEVLMCIPYGQTMSYGQVADAAGCPGGARAVGGANAKNRIPIIIPCHRVIRSDGSLGGFSGPGGTRVKKKLLDLERNFSEDRI